MGYHRLTDDTAQLPVVRGELQDSTYIASLENSATAEGFALFRPDIPFRKGTEEGAESVDDSIALRCCLHLRNSAGDVQL